LRWICLGVIKKPRKTQKNPENHKIQKNHKITKPVS
jgi:hypothetical protein